MVFTLGNDAKALGIAFEKGQIALLLRRQHGKEALPPFLEPGADGTLTGVPERRVADIVGQTGGLNDVAKVGGADRIRQQLALLQPFAHANTQGASHAGHFQGMGQAVMNMVVGPAGAPGSCAPVAGRRRKR